MRSATFMASLRGNCWGDRGKKWYEVLHDKTFICRLITFVSLIFLSTLVALNTLGLYQLYPDFRNIFASPYMDASDFWGLLVFQ